MTATQTSRELRFEPMDPSFTKDPYPMLARFRSEAPVLRWEAGGGPVFFRYRHCLALLRDPRLVTDPSLGETASPEKKSGGPDFAAQSKKSIFYHEGQSHVRLRKLVNPAFSMRALDAHRPKIEAVIDALLDALPRDGVFNVSADFSRQYPVQVISSILSVPRKYKDDFLAFADAAIATAIPGLTPLQLASYMPAYARGVAVVREIVGERRAQPLEGDLLTDLITACDEGERLSDSELVALVGAILTGGADTTVHGTNNAILSLLRNPDQLALLRADPSLARCAFDEALRFEPIQRVPSVRYPIESFSFEGVVLERGKPVFMSLPAALRDPEYVANPDVYDIRRDIAGPSLWFGHGVHYCLGAQLARLEGEIALRRFFARHPRIELAGAPTYGSHPVLRDIVNLPIRIDR